MEQNILVVLWNNSPTIGLIGFSIYLFKKWMNAREDREVAIRAEALQATKDTANTISITHEKSCDEIKEKIGDNRRFYEQTYKDLKEDIKETIRLQKITNGRVNTLEVNVGKLQQSHEDRTGKYERCSDVLTE